ncbi:MAG: FYDLN acid domain-containing protein [Thermoanaerobaculia bacterium]
MTDLGNKHECLSCGTKFYDLGRSQLVCPSCGGDQEELAKGSADKNQAADKSSSSKAKKAKSTKAKKAKSTKAKKDKKEDAPEDPAEETQSPEE